MGQEVEKAMVQLKTMDIDIKAINPVEKGMQEILQVNLIVMETVPEAKQVLA